MQAATPQPGSAAGLLRTARCRAGLSREQVAAVAGVTPARVAAVEDGTEDPAVGALEALLAAAGVELRFALAPVDRARAAAARCVPPGADVDRWLAKVRAAEPLPAT